MKNLSAHVAQFYHKKMWIMNQILFILIVVFLVFKPFAEAVTSLQFEVGAGKIDCFFHPTKRGQEWEVEYQVLDGGDLDVNFVLLDPNGVQLFNDQKSTDNLHKVESKMDGDYRVCFDNSFSRMTPKILFFEIYTAERDDHVDEFRELGAGNIGWSANQELELTVAEIQSNLGKVHIFLERAIKDQEMLKYIEARDRHLMESNYDRVNNFSMMQLTVMIVAGVCQVYVIRSLFEDNSRLGKLLRGKAH